MQSHLYSEWTILIPSGSEPHVQIWRLRSNVQFSPEISVKIIIRWASTNDKSIFLDGEVIYVLSLFGNFPGHLERGQEDSAALFICTEKQRQYKQRPAMS